MATAAVFGFLSFAGFEGAAALGEETDQPGRNIPRAIFLAAVAPGGARRIGVALTRELAEPDQRST